MRAYLEREGGEGGDGLLDGDGHVAGAAEAAGRRRGRRRRRGGVAEWLGVGARLCYRCRERRNRDRAGEKEASRRDKEMHHQLVLSREA